MDFSIGETRAFLNAHYNATGGKTQVENAKSDFLEAVKSGNYTTVDSALARHDHRLELATLKEAVVHAAANGDQQILESLAKYLLLLKKPDDMGYQNSAIEPFGLAQFMEELSATHPAIADTLEQAMKTIREEWDRSSSPPPPQQHAPFPSTNLQQVFNEYFNSAENRQGTDKTNVTEKVKVAEDVKVKTEKKPAGETSPIKNNEISSGSASALFGLGSALLELFR